MKDRMKLLAAVVVCVIIAGCSSHSTGRGQAGATAENPVFVQFTETSLNGYWRGKQDNLECHITNVGLRSTGSGAFKDVYGMVYHAQKFRHITYLGGNKWECEQWRHPRNLVFDTSRSHTGWSHAVIEMIDMNTFRVGNEVYERY